MAENGNGRKHRPAMLRRAAIVYAALAAAAVLWCWLTGILPWPLYDPCVSTPGRFGLGVLAGLLLALVVVVLSRVLMARVRGFMRLHHFFREALGPMRRHEVFWVAVLSSVGEELFFRGAMQPRLGLWPAVVAFTVLHFPSRRLLWPWTAMAGALGLAFGYMTHHSGSVAGATVAHLLINAINLDHITRRRPPPGVGGEDRSANQGHPQDQKIADDSNTSVNASPNLECQYPTDGLPRLYSEQSRRCSRQSSQPPRGAAGSSSSRADSPSKANSPGFRDALQQSSGQVARLNAQGLSNGGFWHTPCNRS